MAESTPNTEKKRRRSGEAQVVREQHTRNLLDWTPNLIRMAERQAESGNLRMATDLWEMVLTDDRVQGVIGALCSVASLPMTFDPPMEESEVSNALGGKRGDWWQLLPEPTQQHFIKWGRGLGVALGYIREWYRHPETGTMVPDVQTWSTRNLRYDHIHEQWLVRVQGGTEVQVTPGDGTWLLYTPYGARRPASLAPWRGLSRWWLLKRYALHDWANYSERQGNGTEVIEEEFPKASDGLSGIAFQGEEGDSEKRRKELTADLRRLGRNSKIVLPQGYKYKLVESKANTSETFEKQKSCADTAFAIALVGQNLSSEVNSGSLAAAEVHSRVEGRVIRDVAESLSTFSHDQVFPRYTELNWGIGTQVPWAVYDTTPPEDVKSKAEAQKTFAETLEQMRTAGFEVENAVELGAKLGMTLRKLSDPNTKETTE